MAQPIPVPKTFEAKIVLYLKDGSRRAVTDPELHGVNIAAVVASPAIGDLSERVENIDPELISKIVISIEET